MTDKTFAWIMLMFSVLNMLAIYLVLLGSVYVKIFGAVLGGLSSGFMIACSVLVILEETK